MYKNYIQFNAISPLCLQASSRFFDGYFPACLEKLRRMVRRKPTKNLIPATPLCAQTLSYLFCAKLSLTCGPSGHLFVAFRCGEKASVLGAQRLQLLHGGLRDTYTSVWKLRSGVEGGK